MSDENSEDFEQEKKQGKIIGKPAPMFILRDHKLGTVDLNESLQVSPAMLAFYRHDFHKVCTDQFCDYRDNMEAFTNFGLQIFGISPNDTESQAEFAKQYNLPFLLLSDPNDKVSKQYGCTSFLMLNNISRAIFIVNTKKKILYRYVELTPLTRRTSKFLINVLEQLRANNLL
jgi:thioredoxin-dependent peroxiredoxin